MKPTNVLILFGGESSEHEVSIASAKNVYEAIDKNKYTVSLCYIDRKGQWFYVDSIDNAVSQKQSKRLVPLLGESALFIWPSAKTLRPDVIFPVLHGSNGEDGSVQGLAQLLHIPIVGPSLIGASIAMDKIVAKELLRDAGLPVVPYVVHYVAKSEDYEKVTSKLGAVVFVKPSSQGSSVGVSKVENRAQFESALLAAHEYDTKVLIESAVEGQELEVSVMGNPGTEPRATKAGEIIPGEAFYSYDDKYSSNSTSQVKIPADITAEQQKVIQELACRAYVALEGRGMARVDFFMDKNGTFFINEVNTIPGFTNISMYPKLWEAEGVSYPDLVDSLIRLALEK